MTTTNITGLYLSRCTFVQINLTSATRVLLGSAQVKRRGLSNGKGRIEDVQALRREDRKVAAGVPGGAKGGWCGGRGGGGGRPAIFHRFRVQANFNNIRSIRYSRPHIKSVRANEAPPERRNMMSGGRRVKRGEKRTREVARRRRRRRWWWRRREERPCRRIEGGSDRRGGPRRAQNETCNKVSF